MEEKGVEIDKIVVVSIENDALARVKPSKLQKSLAAASGRNFPVNAEDSSEGRDATGCPTWCEFEVRSVQSTSLAVELAPDCWITRNASCKDGV